MIDWDYHTNKLKKGMSGPIWFIEMYYIQMVLLDKMDNEPYVADVKTYSYIIDWFTVKYSPSWVERHRAHTRMIGGSLFY